MEPTIAHLRGGPLDGERRAVQGCPRTFEYTVWLGESEPDTDRIRTRTGIYQRAAEEPKITSAPVDYYWQGMH